MKNRSFGTPHPCRFALLALSILLLSVMLVSAPSARAQSYTLQTLHSFNSSTEGGSSYGGLVAANGLLYGTTSGGGAHSAGALFSMNPDGTDYRTLYSFGATANDGSTPEAGLTLVNGILYGTTEAGGYDRSGTIFSYDPASGTVTILYSFGQSGSEDGKNPASTLLAVNGWLYGTTQYGGYNDWGMVFKFDLTNLEEHYVYEFNASSGDGGTPVTGLTEVNGVLYGTTSQGGVNGGGTVYAVAPDGSGYHLLHDFDSTNNGDGETPFAGLTAVNDVLYGTTYQGGQHSIGTVYAIHTNGTGYQILHSFSFASGEGQGPYAGLAAANGLLYGTTYHGNGTAKAGTIYSIDPTTGTEDVCYTFSGPTSGSSEPDGVYPRGDLLTVDGVLYGTTFGGGPNNYGTIFSLAAFAAPTASNDSGRGIANHSIVVTAPGVLSNDKNGGDLNTTAVLVKGPTHGTISFHSDGSFTYTPSANFVGTDSFTYKDTNSAGTSNTATCSLTIGPIAYDDQGRTYFDTAVTISAPGVLANDVTGGLTTTTALVTNPAHGTITFNSNGGFKYTPSSGFLGTDSFTYKITNAGGTSAPATCSIAVLPRTPVANNDTGRVTHNTTLTVTAPGVLGNDNPGTTGTVTAALVTHPSHGTITFNSNGSFVYKPTTGFIGTDSFTYKDTNSVGSSNTATCMLTVQ